MTACRRGRTLSDRRPSHYPTVSRPAGPSLGLCAAILFVGEHRPYARRRDIFVAAQGEFRFMVREGAVTTAVLREFPGRSFDARRE